MHKDILIAAIAIVVIFGATYGLRQVLFKFLQKWVGKTQTNIDDIIINSIKTPFLFWGVLLGISFAMKATSLSQKVSVFVDKITIIIWVISLTLVVSRIVVETIKAYSEKLQQSNAFPVTTLTRNVANITIFTIGSLIILNLLGISIAPILTALGIGGLAVALALQETLSNLFAGIYTILNKQVNVGEYIKLDSGQEGYVIDIGWRSTKVRALQNNIIVIPNSKLAQAIVTNYYQPDKELAILIDMSVSYKSNLDNVEKIVTETATEIMKTVNGGIPSFQPFIRYNNFGDSNINFTVIMRGKEFVDKYLLIHEFIKSVKKKFDREKIVIEYPTRNVILNR
ncbi:MAG: hypothetical protein A2297_08205 [Elusimicrobia bacterium RIFOXYB2_FULL_48_7]|nr:MAG: hypothetical protein A2297_08205 [Elusimicrobia bacterium RIFOXYB2_FULL_48_7]